AVTDIIATSLVERIVPTYRELYPDRKELTRALVKLATVGNLIDLNAFHDVSDVEAKFMEAQHRSFMVSAFDSLYDSLDKGTSLVYLLDNSGECACDRAVLEHIGQAYPNITEVTIAVKAGPLINDVTMADINNPALGFLDLRFGPDRVKPTFVQMGSKEGGKWPNSAKACDRQMLLGADTVISKGQGNFESLCDVNWPQNAPMVDGVRERVNIYFLFMCKCERMVDLLTSVADHYTQMPPSATPVPIVRGSVKTGVLLCVTSEPETAQYR
ncbi:uncharacterised conserved protein UCP006593, partial [Kipferlia bialata]